MMGFFVLFLAVMWVAIVGAVVIVVTLVLPKKWWRTLVRTVLILVLIPAPLVDDYLGGKQFEELCIANSEIRVAPNSAGKTVYLQETKRTIVPGTWVPIVSTPWRFVDANTGEVLVSYNTLQASGGHFTRGLSEGGVPLTFRANCEPGGIVDPVRLLEQHQIIQIQRSALGVKELK